jgi:hypothetical protein
MSLWEKITCLAGPGLLVLGAIFFAGTATKAAAPKDTLVVTAETTLGGVVPTTPGNSGQWFYAYCVVTGNTLSDTIPVAVQVEDTSGSAPGTNSYTIAFSKNGAPLSADLTLPSNFTAYNDGSTITVDISLSGTFNTSGNFPALVQVDSSPSGKLAGAPVNIHILVSVGAACATPPATSCFLTDSEFNLLNDCSGNPVASNTGGTFQIVANGKQIVSTNPGEFYYNLIWTNTSGSSKTVVATFTETHLNTMGANSVHAFVFDSSGFTEDLSAFDMVNQDGTPCGPAGPCTITVPNGEILWLTWHLEYSFIGSSTSGLTTSCKAACSSSDNGYIDATATLHDGTAGGSVLTACTASACGYLKH